MYFPTLNTPKKKTPPTSPGSGQEARHATARGSSWLLRSNETHEFKPMVSSGARVKMVSFSLVINVKNCHVVYCVVVAVWLIIN